MQFSIADIIVDLANSSQSVVRWAGAFALRSARVEVDSIFMAN